MAQNLFGASQCLYTLQYVSPAQLNDLISPFVCGIKIRRISSTTIWKYRILCAFEDSYNMRAIIEIHVERVLLC